MSGSTVVLYHGPECMDGFGSAWAAHAALGDMDVVYIPVNYGMPPPAEIDGGVKRLFILDFSYPRPVLERLAGLVDEILVLDHHRTAQADLEGLPYAKFDMEKSGAVLSWEHFHPGRPVPYLLQLVQDRDLWTWKLPGSREINAGLSIVLRTFSEWDRWAKDLDGPHDQHAIDRLDEWGHAILAAQTRHVASLCDRAFVADVGGHNVPAVNSPVFQSEIGDELCRRNPEAPFAACFAVGPDEEVWSLRSRGGFDVSEVAKSLGGGGHRAASGFRRPRAGSGTPASGG